MEYLSFDQDSNLKANKADCLVFFYIGVNTSQKNY